MQSPGGVSGESDEVRDSKSASKESDIEVVTEDDHDAEQIVQNVTKIRRVTFAEVLETSSDALNNIEQEKTKEIEKPKEENDLKPLKRSSSSFSTSEIDISNSPHLKDHSRPHSSSSTSETDFKLRCFSRISFGCKSKTKPVKRSLEEMTSEHLDKLIQPSTLLKTSKKEMKILKSKLLKQNTATLGQLSTFTTVENASKIKLFDLESVFRWRSSQVCSFLEIIGLKNYATNFLINGVDGSTFLELSQSHFKNGLGIENDFHLFSVQIAVLNLLSSRKLTSRNEKIWKSFFTDWSMDETLLWVEKRGFHILKDRFKERAIHGGVLLNLDLDVLIEKVIEVESITTSPVAKCSLRLSILRARKVENNFFNQKNEEKDVLDWGLDEVENWLKSVNVGHKMPSFKDHCVNGTMLLHLTYENMREMGLSEIMSIVLTKALNNLKRYRRSLRKQKPKSKEKVRTDSEEKDEIFQNFTKFEEKYRSQLESLRQQSKSFIQENQ